MKPLRGTMQSGTGKQISEAAEEFNAGPESDKPAGPCTCPLCTSTHTLRKMNVSGIPL